LLAEIQGKLDGAFGGSIRGADEAAAGEDGCVPMPISATVSAGVPHG
jgi:hypothetical protein